MNTFLIILGIIIGVIGLIFLFLVIAAYQRRPKFRKKGFTKLEKRLLEELYDLFDNQTQNKLKAQIEYFEPKRKWRKYWEKSMSVELYGENNDPLSDQFKYPRKDEGKLATIRFEANNKKYSIEYSSYDGRIFGWIIRPKPKSIMKLNSVRITSKKINNDPNDFAQPAFKKEKFKTLPAFTGLINQMQSLTPIKNAFQPIDQEFLDNYVKRVNAILPEDYLDIIKQTEGLDFDEYSILGISEIYTTGLDDGNYYHLVEFDDGVITVKEEDSSGTIYYCHYSGLIDNLGIDFSKAVLERARQTNF